MDFWVSAGTCSETVGVIEDSWRRNHIWNMTLRMDGSRVVIVIVYVDRHDEGSDSYLMNMQRVQTERTAVLDMPRSPSKSPVLVLSNANR